MDKKILPKSDNEAQLYVDKLVFWYAFLMAFPALMIVQNVSIYLFPFLLLGMYQVSGRVFILKYRIQYIAILFGLGAVVSVVGIMFKPLPGNLINALEVLPNYIYWSLLIVFLTSCKGYLRMIPVYEGIFWGLCLSILYYFVLQRFGLFEQVIFKPISQNTFAFLVICYAPISIWFVSQRFGLGAAVVILFIFTLAGFLSGSRSGSLLVMSGGALTLLLNRRNTSSIYILGIASYLFIVLVIDTQFVKQVVFSLNERTYDLVYNREKTLEEDRSYLTRLAQIEKATIIFKKYPWTGIGLNNFVNYKVKLKGDFEGSKLVINKKSINKKSAHNSYFGFLAEGGLFLLVPFMLLLGTCIIWFFRFVNRLNPEDKPIFIGIIHMSIHLYFIYAILNVFAWFLIGLGCVVIVKYKS